MLRWLKSAVLLGAVVSCVFLGAAKLSAQPAGTPPELTVEYIMRDLKWLGSQPSGVEWSPDSRKVYFNWNPNAADRDSLYVAGAKDGSPHQVTLEERKTRPESRGSWDRSFTRWVYSKNGDLFILDVKSGNVRTLTATLDFESSPAFTLDGKAVTFDRDDNVYRIDLASGLLTQLSDFREGSKRDEDEEPEGSQGWVKKENLALFETLQEHKDRRDRRKELDKQLKPKRPLAIYMKKRSLDWAQPSPDGKFICFMLADEPESRKTDVPDYVSEDGYTASSPAREKVGAPMTAYEMGIYDATRDTVYYVTIDSLPGITTPPAYLAEYSRPDSTKDSADAKPARPRSVYYNGPEWSDDGQRCVMEIRTNDFKDRWLATLTLETGRLTVVDHQHDEAWIGGPGIGWQSSLGWLADHKTLWYQSEQTGYSHIYTINVETGERTQRTSGNWEVQNLSVSNNRKTWYFQANMDHAGDWQACRLSTSGGQPVKLSSGQGEHRAYVSPDETKLAILSSTSTRPTQLYLQDNKPGAKPKAITQSISSEFLSYPWREAEIVHIPASDGAKVPARVYRPRQPAPGGPGVIFVHGAGYLQNVTYGWSGYDHEYLFHNLLADRGYTVLDIDYRASSGYGRDWRTAIYRHMGGRDLDDQIDGAKFLVSEYGVDSSRIGIYGGSYGGFITLMALFKHPHVFACGAALRSVTDWAHYNHWYTARILNTPDTDSLAYVQSSPMYFADGLADPLLMCHSILDENVQFQDIVRLSQKFIELGKKDWELAVYPVEDHSIIESEAWTDEYRRIFELFETHLNAQQASGLPR